MIYFFILFYTFLYFFILYDELFLFIFGLYYFFLYFLYTFILSIISINYVCKMIKKIQKMTKKYILKLKFREGGEAKKKLFAQEKFIYFKMVLPYFTKKLLIPIFQKIFFQKNNFIFF